MLRTRLCVGAAVAVLGIAGVPGSASADWLITPFVGANVGGDADFGAGGGFNDEVEKRVDVGATFAWMGAGIIGAEVDFGYSPNFFENTIGTGDFEFGDSHELTLMANLLVGIPVGGEHGPGVRPYASGGVGLMRSQASGSALFNDIDENDFGFDVGGGVQGFFTDNVGIRGDVRYFRSLQDHAPGSDFDLGLSDFDFWRATLGVTFRFGG